MKQVKMAAINFVLNIVWKDNADSASREKRKKALKELGAESKLKELAGDTSDLEVRDKALHTLTYFN